MDRDDDTRTYHVMVDIEAQDTTLLAGNAVPAGRSLDGTTGPKAQSLQYVDDVRTDMRPLGLRKRIDSVQRKR